MNLYIKKSGLGQSLVLLHGWGFDHNIWLPLVAELEKKFTVYLVDLPGFGKSQNMSWKLFKQELNTQLPANFLIAGWSLGGLFATRLAFEEPHKIIKIINVCSSPCFIKKENWPGISEELFFNFYNKLNFNPQKTLTNFIKAQLLYQDKEPVNKQIIMGSKINAVNYSFIPHDKFVKNDGISLLMPKTAPQISSLQEGLQILHSWDLRSLLVELKIPAYYIFGNLDMIVPRIVYDSMQGQYTNLHYFILNKAAHLPFLSHKREFLQIFFEILL